MINTYKYTTQIRFQNSYFSLTLRTLYRMNIISNNLYLHPYYKNFR